MTPLKPGDMELLRDIEQMVLTAFPEVAFVSGWLSTDPRTLHVAVGLTYPRVPGRQIRISTYIQGRVPFPAETAFLLGTARTVNEGSQQAQVS